MNDRKLKRALRNTVVSAPVLFLIGIILFCTDFFLSQPLYALLIDNPVLGKVLALGMATLFSVLPKVTGKLLVQRRSWLIGIAFTLALGLLAFIYIGQSEVALQKANDPLEMLLNPDSTTETGTQKHVIATGLIGLLYGFSVFLSYLYYADAKAFEGTDKSLTMSRLWRALQYRLLLLKGRFDRAFGKPKIIAEGRVNDHLISLEREEREQQNKLARMEHEYRYELDMLKNARARIRLAIETAYLKKIRI